MPFKRGDVRKDGKIFWQRKNTEIDKEGYFSETWYTPERYAEVYQDNLKRLRKFAKENPEIVNEWNRKSAKRNRPQRNANWAKYFYSKIDRTPKWLTKEQHLEIKKIYAECMEMTKITGIKHNVDHIVPLRGDLVSGLHVPWNLRIIPASENFKKSNKYGSQ